MGGLPRYAALSLLLAALLGAPAGRAEPDAAGADGTPDVGERGPEDASAHPDANGSAADALAADAPPAADPHAADALEAGAAVLPDVLEAGAAPDAATEADVPDAAPEADAPATDAAPAVHGDASPARAPPAVHPPRTPPEGPTLSTADAIKAIFGLVLLLALAYIGGHPRVQRLEQKLRISQVITAGFPFVIIGLVSREGSLGILSEPVLDAIRPLLPLGLGWIGFAVGYRFDVRKLDHMPPLAGVAFVATTAVPYLFIVGAMSAVLLVIHEAGGPALILRDALVLATAGAMTAVALPTILAKHGADRTDIARVDRIIQLEELAALLGILVIGAFFRPDQADLGWRLPSVGWVFVTFGIGTALSGLTLALLGTIRGSTETLVVMLGSICFTAGMASFLRLSPVVVCFIAGAVLQNFPGPWKAQVGAALARVERPVYLLFLVIAGALWRVDEWQGWVLMLVFVAARLLGRVAGVAIFGRRHPEALTPVERRHLAISPMGALSLAIVVTAQDLYSGPSVPWMVNAVIGGAILTEIIVQVFAFEPTKRAITRTNLRAFVGPPTTHVIDPPATISTSAPPDRGPEPSPSAPAGSPGGSEP